MGFEHMTCSRRRPSTTPYHFHAKSPESPMFRNYGRTSSVTESPCSSAIQMFPNLSEAMG